jgi:RNA polymerase sigma-70 factor (ECF subfamily)
MMDVSDSELMLRLAAGDDLALNTLMDRWGGRVSAFLFRMTANRETAVDLAEETFVRLYQACSRYQPTGTFSTYLFAIASNLARNHARWRVRHPTVALDAASDDGSTSMQEATDPGQNPAEAAQCAERIQAVHRSLIALPSDLREAMLLFIYEGLGYADIAVLAGCSVKAVETRIYRARQILKNQLKDLRS